MPGELRSRHPRVPPLIYRGSSLSRKTKIQQSAPQYIYYRKSVTTESTFERTLYATLNVVPSI
jgi:hypothetical protein